ncbi:hypothetical protein D0Z07_3876 [Hyphodiscus hymeniophilus]|uniref:Uncharacterized protein n=1 Tax=Hyphodiscus hymeniophilus TaxID=353542 RepID=A0A9P6VL35_9HELO|nr:hypothetical protein D0Z07_3876 [Hyphodiscus hymeniophilus]
MAYPSLPASPTLTNPDMILPYGKYDSDPSPPEDDYELEEVTWRRGPRDMQFSIGPAHAPLGTITPTTPIIYGNGTMLSDIGEVTEAESTPGRKLPGPAERRMLKQQAQAAAVRSSPTLGNNPIIRKRSKVGTHGRKSSMESTSTITSDAHAAELFNDFDDGVSVDDSVFLGDDEESVADSYTEEVIAAETQRLSKREANVGQEEDQNSSAALSRRAEHILLNAKKRLNNMEGNLTRARSSLYITPSSSMSSIHSSSPLARSTPSPPNRIISQSGVPAAKHRQLNSPADSPSSPGHSRVYSENSISSGLRNAPFPVRSASAAARYMGKAGVEASQRSPTISHSPDNVGEPLNKTSPPRLQLEALSEHDVIPEFDTESVRSSMDESRDSGGEHRGLTRSVSSMQMRDLRDQMHDLKGRLSVLRDRARDDTMKRRSLQSLRTPSPFTAAEQWYTGSHNYVEGALSADAGVAHPPWKEDETKSNPSGETPRSESKTPTAKNEDTAQIPEDAASDDTSVYEDVGEEYRDSGGLDKHEPRELEEEDHDTAVEGLPGNGDDVTVNDYNDEMVNHDELDEYDSDASLYHDTLTTPLSHEDREDAFDYEHFFLHSAMGTISQQRHGRRDSVGSYSSEDSVETTRGPTAPSGPSERPSAGHLRSGSTDSISTIGTFATATEGRRSMDGEETDDFAVQHVIAPPVRTTTPVTAKRSTFGSPAKNGLPNDRQPSPEALSRPSSAHNDTSQWNGSNFHRPSVASFDSFESTGTSRSFPLVNKPRGQKSLTPDVRASHQSGSILNVSATLIGDHAVGDRMQPSPVHMLARDDQILVEKLVASLGKCVLGLQEAGKGSYESKAWRRRLDSARRILEGEEGLI